MKEVTKFIESSLFENSNSFTNGGAITIINVPGIMITNTIFRKNTAANQGGALLFKCNNFGARFDLCAL